MAEDDSWVFDSLVAFLNGPVWNAPLQSFIEERSLIFEPNETHNEEYKTTFSDFKKLVDFMLGNFMEDIGITPPQFESACFKGAKEGVPLHFDQNTFDQIWAANDYEMFKRMMTQRNVELQLQALELIERKFGRTPELFIPYKKGAENANKQESSSANQVVSKSAELEREVLVEVSRAFPVEEESAEKGEEEEIKYYMEEKTNLEETLKKAIEEKLSIQKHILEQTEDESEETTTKEPEIKIDKPRIPIDKPQNKKVEDFEMKKRQEYLRAQRDKLVALKKEVRKKQLDTETEKVPVGGKPSLMRPKSARAAESILSGGNAANIDSENIKLRKALVERLKSEVVQNKK